MVGRSVGLFLMPSCYFSVLVHDKLPTSVLSVSFGFNLSNTVSLGMQTLLYAVFSVGIFSDFGYLWLILWPATKGMRPKGRSFWCQGCKCVVYLTQLVFKLLLLIYLLTVNKILLQCKLLALNLLKACWCINICCMWCI